jgi:hypothetical protein
MVTLQSGLAFLEKMKKRTANDSGDVDLEPGAS